ncbi:hypothetical protein LTR62_003467 [Meristemomyces frigidus]|uniref:Oxidase ustYa n=1 Tax=Meristemomyces frigidus TaxID=1508187 RepID=A0AAN7TKZ4_9PEZI|nr:hypothetical protein LTR62_003467 [Meristemomyces frigidus]
MADRRPLMTTLLWNRSSTDKHTYEGVAPDEDGPSPAEEIASLRHSHQRLKLWLIAISVVSGFAFLILAAGAKYQHKLPLTLRPHPSPVPHIPMVPKTLDQDNRFAVMPSTESDHMWHSLIPSPGAGFVEITNPRQYPELKPGMIGTNFNNEVYGVSIFHQLHCIIHIRHHLFALDSALDALAGNGMNTTQLEGLRKMNGHINHCFDFVRQALMCNADLTLEWPRSVEDEGEGKGVHGIVDGNGVPHQCKDWGTVFEWAGRNAFAQDRPV